jgi:PAP2 superfamily
VAHLWHIVTDLRHVPCAPAQFRRSRTGSSAPSLVAVPGALTLLLVEDKWAPLLRADDSSRDRLHDFAVTHTGFVAAMRVISDSGSALALQIVLGSMVAWLLWRRLPRLALFVVITAAGSSLLNTVFKNEVHPLRPVLTHPVAHEPGPSFPSGHAQAAIVGFAVLLLVFLPVLDGLWRRLAVTFAVLMVLAIGFSRIAVGVHYLPMSWAATCWARHGWQPWPPRSTRCASNADAGQRILRGDSSPNKARDCRVPRPATRNPTTRSRTLARGLVLELSNRSTEQDSTWWSGRLMDAFGARPCCANQAPTRDGTARRPVPDRRPA